jgi:hypothetical protein
MPDYATAFFAWALTFAQRFLAAFEIFARPAADSTRFLALVRSWDLGLPPYRQPPPSDEAIPALSHCHIVSDIGI